MSIRLLRRKNGLKAGRSPNKHTKSRELGPVLTLNEERDEEQDDAEVENKKDGNDSVEESSEKDQAIADQGKQSKDTNLETEVGKEKEHETVGAQKIITKFLVIQLVKKLETIKSIAFRLNGTPGKTFNVWFLLEYSWI